MGSAVRFSVISLDTLPDRHVTGAGCGMKLAADLRVSTGRRVKGDLGLAARCVATAKEATRRAWTVHYEVDAAAR
jgi:hypothetical protein